MDGLTGKTSVRSSLLLHRLQRNYLNTNTTKKTPLDKILDHHPAQDAEIPSISLLLGVVLLLIDVLGLFEVNMANCTRPLTTSRKRRLQGAGRSIDLKEHAYLLGAHRNKYSRKSQKPQRKHKNCHRPPISTC